MQEILQTLEADASSSVAASLNTIRFWSDAFVAVHLKDFESRAIGGFIRECHGDLHLQNVVHWNGKLVPFDGIEFSDDFRFIDVISDAAFLAMDFAARGHLDLARSFINRYLEQTGDYKSLVVLRWYMVYRSLVRAMVAKMRAEQHASDLEIYEESIKDCHDHINLAYRFTLVEEPSLFITHGFSGSGKTTVSEVVVTRRGAIRLRSDIERKRQFGLTVDDVLDENEKKQIYSGSANLATYKRLERLARIILRCGYPVIIDATFLKHSDRQRFHQFAVAQGVPFAILDCHGDVATLRQRIADRMAKECDASDADLAVLDLQLKSHDPLTKEEQQSVIDIPDLVSTIDQI